jgi:hypothetical protein
MISLTLYEPYLLELDRSATAATYRHASLSVLNGRLTISVAGSSDEEIVILAKANGDIGLINNSDVACLFFTYSVKAYHVVFYSTKVFLRNESIHLCSSSSIHCFTRQSIASFYQSQRPKPEAQERNADCLPSKAC